MLEQCKYAPQANAALKHGRRHRGFGSASRAVQALPSHREGIGSELLEDAAEAVVEADPEGLGVNEKHLQL